MIWTPHLTVAAVIERDGQFLMVKERSHLRTVFNQPAGHVENQETVIDAVIREVKEETAWTFCPEYIIGLYKWRNPDNDTTFLRVCYAGTVSQHTASQALDEDILSAEWIATEKLLAMDNQQLRSPMVKKCIKDYLDDKHYPLDIINEW